MGEDLSEGELVRRLRERRAGSFEGVFQRYREPVWRFLRRLCGGRSSAEDLFQETWLAAARHAHLLREDSRLLPWLYTIARNKHRNAMRFRVLDRRRAKQVLTQPVERPPGPDIEADTRRRAARVEVVFARLPDAYREVLLLVLVEGLSTESVAAILGIREDAVRKRLSRARAELARKLDLDDKGAPDE